VNDRVVVTGLGAITPLGADFPTTWRRLVAGDDAAAPVTVFDVSGCRCKSATQALIPDLPGLSAKRLSRLPRAARLALPAATESLRQAGLLDADGRSKLPLLPVSVSTTGGGMALGEAFMRRVLAGEKIKDQFFRVARYPAQQQVLDLQELLGFRGPITIIANACASGANAIGHARDLIRAGAHDCVLTGGFEALTELIYVGFDCLQALTTDRCRPFDQQRNGLMLGEAAAFMVLESEEHARARGAEILGAVAGYGHATDLHHLTQPRPAGSTQVAVMRTALTEAGLEPGDIAYVNAHGTGTPLNDASECAAFAKMFEASLPSISSTKAAIGHTLGAAGAIEALFTLQALRTGELPPQINLRTAEPVIANNLVKPGERRPGAKAMMSVNLGFGGSNAALVLVGAASPPRPARIHRGGVAITGYGAVLPTLSDSMLSLGGRKCAAQRVDQQSERLTRWQNHPRVRRATPITWFMLEAAQQALDVAGEVDRARLGIVAAFGSGSLVASRRFYEGVLKNGQRFASPNLFPETVFNSPTSHVAAVLGAAGPAYSVVGDDSTWVNAVGVARGWLRAGTVDAALVIGAEELDPIILDAYRAGRWLRDGNNFTAGEGAGAVLLRLTSGGVRIERVVEGFTFRSHAQAERAAKSCVAALAGVPLWPASERPFAFTASAAWQTVDAVEAVRRQPQRVAVPVWGRNEQCSALILDAR